MFFGRNTTKERNNQNRHQNELSQKFFEVENEDGLF